MLALLPRLRRFARALARDAADADDLCQIAIEKALLCGSLFLVLSAEVMNSAIEAVVDKASPEFHELAGRAKDMGSAAVFLLMLNFMLTW